ncbi:MAG: hypothetical protein EOO65_01555 [Methanosarcinales archaeon]|nr:MAG: hypothetical protein EOO65_01555 [Methanosarcinales archaeon]
MLWPRTHAAHVAFFPVLSCRWCRRSIHCHVRNPRWLAYVGSSVHPHAHPSAVTQPRVACNCVPWYAVLVLQGHTNNDMGDTVCSPHSNATSAVKFSSLNVCEWSRYGALSIAGKNRKLSAKVTSHVKDGVREDGGEYNKGWIWVEGTWTNAIRQNLPEGVTVSKKCQMNFGSVLGKHITFPKGILPAKTVPDLMACPTSMVPGYFGEFKSSPEPTVLQEQLALDAAAAIIAAFFPDKTPRDDKKGSIEVNENRFLTQPPSAFGLAGNGALVAVVVCEMVGSLFMSFFSDGFLQHSPRYTKAMRAIYEERKRFCTLNYVDLAKVEFLTCQTNGKWGSVLWTVEPKDGCFFKVLRLSVEGCMVRWMPGGTRHFENMHRAYTRYVSAFANCAQVPASLIGARMLYGRWSVAVQAPWLPSNHITDLSASDATEAIAVALVWLAVHGMLYVDLRPQNVVRLTADCDVVGASDSMPAALLRNVPKKGQLVLIDYDDVIVSEKSIRTYDEFLVAIRGQPCNNVTKWFPGTGDSLETAVQTAFDTFNASPCSCKLYCSVVPHLQLPPAGGAAAASSLPAHQHDASACSECADVQAAASRHELVGSSSSSSTTTSPRQALVDMSSPTPGADDYPSSEEATDDDAGSGGAAPRAAKRVRCS